MRDGTLAEGSNRETERRKSQSKKLSVRGKKRERSKDQGWRVWPFLPCGAAEKSRS